MTDVREYKRILQSAIIRAEIFLRRLYVTLPYPYCIPGRVPAEPFSVEGRDPGSRRVSEGVGVTMNLEQ